MRQYKYIYTLLHNRHSMSICWPGTRECIDERSAIFFTPLLPLEHSINEKYLWPTNHDWAWAQYPFHHPIMLKATYVWQPHQNSNMFLNPKHNTTVLVSCSNSITLPMSIRVKRNILMALWWHNRNPYPFNKNPALTIYIPQPSTTWIVVA